MELNYTPIRRVGGERRRIAEPMSTAAGLSSPQQLVEVTASLSVKIDQTAAGSSLIIFKPEEIIRDQQDDIFAKPLP